MSKEVDPLNEKDLEAALNSMAAELPEGDFAQLGPLAGQWLLNKFKYEPDTLPATFVIKLFLDFQKAVASKQLPDEEGQRDVSVLEMVRDSTLPDERKKELLIEERDSLEDELEQVRLQLEEM